VNASKPSFSRPAPEEVLESLAHCAAVVAAHGGWGSCVSCCMRDAAALEKRGIPTTTFANDVFVPIAHGTASLLGVPPDYVENHVIFFPHPTSTLAREDVGQLVDRHIEKIVASLTSTEAASTAGDGAVAPTLATIRTALAPLAASMHEDGAELTVDAYDADTVHLGLRLDAGCADGSCILPAANLLPMLRSILSQKLSAVPAIVLDDPRER